MRNGISVWVSTAKESLFEDHLGQGPTSVVVRGDVLAIHVKSQTDLVGKRDDYLCRSQSLSHRVGSAEGTRREQMWTDQNHLVECFTKFPSATGTLNLIQARGWNRNWDLPDHFGRQIPLLNVQLCA